MAVDPVLSAGLPTHKKHNIKLIKYSQITLERLSVPVLVCRQCASTCVDLVAFLWAQRGSTGLSSLLLLAFSANGTEGRGVAQGREGRLKCMEQSTDSEVNTMDLLWI